jgi:hypothetical protein
MTDFMAMKQAHTVVSITLRTSEVSSAELAARLGVGPAIEARHLPASSVPRRPDRVGASHRVTVRAPDKTRSVEQQLREIVRLVPLARLQAGDLPADLEWRFLLEHHFDATRIASPVLALTPAAMRLVLDHGAHLLLRIEAAIGAPVAAPAPSAPPGLQDSHVVALFVETAELELDELARRLQAEAHPSSINRRARLRPDGGQHSREATKTTLVVQAGEGAGTIEGQFLLLEERLRPACLRELGRAVNLESWIVVSNFWMTRQRRAAVTLLTPSSLGSALRYDTEVLVRVNPCSDA